MSQNSEIPQTERKTKVIITKPTHGRKGKSAILSKDRQDNLNEVSRRQESAYNDHKDEQDEYLSAMNQF